MTPLIPKNSPGYSSFMFSLSMASLTTSPLTTALSLSPNSRVPLPKPLTWNFTLLLDTIQRPTDKWNVQIKPWNSTSASIVLINRTTGIYYYLLLNLHTTMRRTPPPESLHSSPTKATILISLFIWEQEHDIASARACDFVVNLDELHQFLRDKITQAQSRYKIQADKRRNLAPPFKVGDRVFLSSKHIKTTRPTAKFAEKFLGPFEIIAQPGSHSFTLKLLSDLRAIHPIFHVSQLEPVEENTIPNRTQPPPPPVEVDGEEQYEIAQILDSKIDRRFWCPLLYRIQWLGYEGTDEEFAWLLATEFSADDFIEDFHCRYPDKPGPLTKVTIRKSTI